MKISYNHLGNILTFARIAQITIDNDFEKTTTDNKGIQTITKGHILIDIKLYPSEDAWKQYGNHTHIIENIPIEGANFVMCTQEINQIEKVIESFINMFFKNRKE